MRIAQPLHVTLFAVATMIASVACGAGDTSEPESADSDLTGAKPLSDAALAALLASPPPSAKLTLAARKKLVAATINPLATTARLRLLNDFIAKGAASDDEGNYQSLASAMEPLYWGTPRDVVATPAAAGGQKLKTSFEMTDAGGGPTRLEVIGVASSDYELEFMLAGVKITVARVPAGSTPGQTAKLIADTIEGAQDDVTGSFDHEMVPIGGDHADMRSGWDGMDVSVDGAAVVIQIELNG